MNCTRHPGVAAAGFCTQCGRPMCASCLPPQANHPVCPDCAGPAAQPSAPTPVVYTPPPVPAVSSAIPRSRGPSPGVWIGLGCVLLALTALIVVGAVFGLRYVKAHTPQPPPPVASTNAPPETATTHSGTATPTPDTEATDDTAEAVAEARKVMEAFIALDKVHDGAGMAKLLAGTAAANFRADIQGQGDAETVEEYITGAKLVEDAVVRFEVKTVSKDLATGELSEVCDLFTVRQSDDSWRITEIEYR